MASRQTCDPFENVTSWPVNRFQFYKLKMKITSRMHNNQQQKCKITHARKLSKGQLVTVSFIFWKILIANYQSFYTLQTKTKKECQRVLIIIEHTGVLKMTHSVFEWQDTKSARRRARADRPRPKWRVGEERKKERARIAKHVTLPLKWLDFPIRE